MGLASWIHAPADKVIEPDVTVANIHVSKAHITELNRVISTYLDPAEQRAQRHIATTTVDGCTFLDGVLLLCDNAIVQNNGKVSALRAKTEYTEFRAQHDREHLSDFYRGVRRLHRKKCATETSTEYHAQK